MYEPLPPDQAADSIKDMYERFELIEGIPIFADSDERWAFIIASTNLLPDDLFVYGDPIVANFYEEPSKPRLTVPVTFSDKPSLLEFVDSQMEHFVCQCYVSDTIDVDYNTVIFEFK